MKANPLKPEFSRFGTFDQLGENTREQVKSLVTSLDTKNAVAGSAAQQIGDLYAMGMDSVRLNEQGATPILKDVETINNTKREDLIDLMATLVGVDAFFGTSVDADMMNSEMNTMYWSQGGLGLGDRDYYLEDSENTNAIREAYKTYIKTITSLAGYDEAAQQRVVDNVMRIETALAKAAMSREELRDPAASYNPMTLAQIAKDYPNVDLKRYFAKQGIDSIEIVIIGQPKSLAAVNEILGKESEEALRDYITAGYIASAASYLSDDFINANFELRKVISGVQQLQPRWKRALAIPNGLLGEALGQLYVEKYFPQSSKDKMLDLVNNLKVALGQHIDALTWMSDSTKAQAHEKLSTFTVKIGFPDKWRDYSDLTIDPSKSYWENVQAAIKHNVDFFILSLSNLFATTLTLTLSSIINSFSMNGLNLGSKTRLEERSEVYRLPANNVGANVQMVLTLTTGVVVAVNIEEPRNFNRFMSQNQLFANNESALIHFIKKQVIRSCNPALKRSMEFPRLIDSNFPIMEIHSHFSENFFLGELVLVVDASNNLTLIVRSTSIVVTHNQNLVFSTQLAHIIDVANVTKNN
jgi:hypothetical protein